MRGATLLLTLLLAAAGASVAVADETHARNHAYFRALVGDADLAQPATMPDGRTLALDDALAEAAARAGDVDLAALASGAASPFPIQHVGDVWVIETGDGACSVVDTGVRQPFFLPIDSQLWTYAGNLSTMSTSQGDLTQIIGWTMKTWEQRADSLGFTAEGVSDLYCIHFDERHFAFPFLDGEAHMNVGMPVRGA